MEHKALMAANKVAQEIALEDGYQLYSVEVYKEGATEFLEVLIDKDYQITLEQIETYANRLSQALDDVAELSTPYTLDVSSPGLEREFPKEDLAKLKGRYIAVQATAEENEVAYGEVLDFDGATLVLQHFEKGRKKIVKVPYESIRKCRFLIK